MPAPSVDVQITDQPAQAFSPSTANAFVVGYADRGPVDTPVPITSLAHFVTVFGPRVSYGYLYDTVEAFFREGGGLIYVVRLVGPEPVNATANVLDQSGSSAPGDVALVATAKSPGAWGDKLNIEITVDGTDFQVLVSHDDDGDLETSPLLADRAEAVAWSAGSSYITLTLGASDEDPRAQGPTGLAGGDDDRGDVGDDEIEAAWELYTADYGPGQVAMPGFTTADAHEAVLAHAHEHRRIAILDPIDTDTATTIRDAAVALRDIDGHRFAGVFGPWAAVPAGAGGQEKTIPYSAIQLGLTGRSEGEGKSVGDPVAGANGVSRWAVGLARDYSPADRDLLAEAGVSLARFIRGSVRTYDYVSLANQVTDPNWVPLNGARTICAIAHEVGQVGEQHLMKKLDGKGRTIADFIGDAKGVCLRHFSNGDLFGTTPDEAFTVTDNNTPESIAQNKLRCAISAATSGFGRHVEIEITKEASR